ncbi:GntR family transcriptional regulator [Antrihabitans sp. NCIMB 15449]|uniref:GntR family transcriptional regulator n=1 Tax=Antrihabitans spumae TaxID=3373370 RepID=A0ABW7JRS5_9NOCA
MDTELDTEPGSLREQAYRELRRRLMAGELTARTRLVETRVAELIGASRTPVREALVRLHADGMLTREADGYYPVIPDLAGVRDLYELRITLELQGITRLIDNPHLRYDAEILERLRDDWLDLRAAPPEPGPDIVLLDEDYHIRLSSAAGNPALTRALQAVNGQIRLVRMYDYATEERVSTTISEHLEIVDLLLTEDLPGARTALHHHVGSSYDVVEERAAHAVTAHALGRPVLN